VLCALTEAAILDPDKSGVEVNHRKFSESAVRLLLVDKGLLLRQHVNFNELGLGLLRFPSCKFLLTMTAAIAITMNLTQDVLNERNALWSVVLHIEGASVRLSNHSEELSALWDSVNLYLFNGCVLLADNGNKLLFMPMDLAGICIETVRKHRCRQLLQSERVRTNAALLLVNPDTAGVHLRRSCT
jgi:hypothetical protein